MTEIYAHSDLRKGGANTIQILNENLLSQICFAHIYNLHRLAMVSGTCNESEVSSISNQHDIAFIDAIMLLLGYATWYRIHNALSIKIFLAENDHRCVPDTVYKSVSAYQSQPRRGNILHEFCTYLSGDRSG
jgi:hypothetical protein